MGDGVEKRKHDEILSSTIRAIICGPSNCGKTNVLISLIEWPNNVRFENVYDVYVYSKSLQQPKYQYYLDQKVPGIPPGDALSQLI